MSNANTLTRILPKSAIQWGLHADNGYLLLSSIVFLLSPILSLPLIFYGIYQRKRGSFLLLALFLGLLGWMLAPLHDLFRHSYTYYYYQQHTFSQAINPINLALNGASAFVFWTLSHLLIPFETMRAVEVAIGFHLLCIVFNYMIDSSPRAYTKREVFFRFLIFLFFFDFYYVTEGIRYGFALCIYFYALHQLINLNRRWTAIALFAFAACWHLAFFYFIPATVAIYALKLRRRTYLLAALAMIVVMLIGMSQLSLLVGERRANWYLGGKKQDFQFDGMTATGLTIYFLMKMTALPFAALLLLHYNVGRRWGRMMMGWLVLSVSVAFNAVLLYRTWWAFTGGGIYVLLEIERYAHVSRKWLYTMLVGSLMFLAIDTLHYQSYIRSSDYYRAALPVPYILSQTYSHQWLNYNVKPSGEHK